tara:strand:+ start:189 stop:794 length:606 start_codon:yes stop_codon:yes gene_type:complete
MALYIEDIPGIMDRKNLLNKKLKDLNQSAQNLDFQSATWAIYFIKKNLDVTLSELAVPFFSTLTIVATLSCGISTGILVTENHFLLSAIPGAIGTMGCLTTVLLCVLLENTIRQISSPDVFLEFIIKNRRLIRLPVPIFAISIHGISLQIIFYTWKCGIILGTITGSITLVSCGVVHYYQQNFQNMLKEHRKNTFLEMSII